MAGFCGVANQVISSRAIRMARACRKLAKRAGNGIVLRAAGAEIMLKRNPIVIVMSAPTVGVKSAK